MANLIYCTITSLDGFVEDSDGQFDWGAPSEEVSAFINRLERGVGTYLYGRRMYETMLFWEAPPTDDDAGVAELEFTQMWQSAEKIVYSRTLNSVASRRTRIEHEFVPDEVRRLKATAGADLTVAGAELAAQALRAGLVDEIQLFVVPISLGGGKRALPADLRLDLDLRDEVRFASDVVHLRYGVGAVAG